MIQIYYILYKTYRNCWICSQFSFSRCSRTYVHTAAQRLFSKLP